MADVSKKLRRNYLVARTHFGAWRYLFFTTRAEFDACLRRCEMLSFSRVATYYPVEWCDLPLVGAGIGALHRPESDDDDVEVPQRSEAPVVEHTDDVLAFDLAFEAVGSFVADLARRIGKRGDE